MSLFESSVYQRLVQETADAREYAKSISGVYPVMESEAETEIRLKPYAPRTSYDTGVHERVKKFCLRVPREVYEEVSTVYLYEDNLRRIVDDSTGNEVYQRKTTLYKHDNTAFSIRAAVSREDTLSAKFRPTTDPVSTRKRVRTRISYEGVMIDLTTSTTMKIPKRKAVQREEPEVNYEIEIEIPKIEEHSYESLHRIIRTMFRVIRDTEVPYPISLYTMMADFYNNTLSQEVNVGRRLTVGDFDRDLQSKARTLKVKDLVYGGIVGKKVHYSVTPKADGVRTALMLHNTGVWLYYGNGLLNCLHITKDFQDLHGTILDVEAIPMENRTVKEAKKTQHFIVAFDVLSLSSNFARGSTSVQLKNHKERMIIADSICGTVEERLSRARPGLAMFRTKTFYYTETVDDFFEAVSKARALIDGKDLPYMTDGLVFTPSNLKSVPYPNIDRIPPNKRVLIDYPDIVKFKPVSQLTIDFAVDVRGRQLLVSHMGELVPFTARGFNSTINVAWKECIEKGYPKNTIVEFSWKDSQFHPIRLRNDKDRPNRLPVARDNFERIHEGLTYDSLEGKTGLLMAKYHNRVKTSLYTTASMARQRLLGDSKKYTLLDLGSGEGGDISKWASAGFTSVLAVEPSRRNVDAMKRRLENLLRDRRDLDKFPEIEIINTGAEDTDQIVSYIPGHKFDVISSMLSASFFWKDDETLRNVVRTIKTRSKKGTTFLIFTINGQLIEEMISPSMREGVILESPIILGDITFDIPIKEWEEQAGRRIGGPDGLLPHSTGRGYHITFKNTKTVHAMDDEVGTAQKEYMVYIPQLTEALQPEFVMRSHEIANKEPLLLGSSRIASSLYSYAIYERVTE